MTASSPHRCARHNIAIAAALIVVLAINGCGQSVADSPNDGRQEALSPQDELADPAEVRRAFQAQVDAVGSGSATEIKVEEPGITDDDLASLVDLDGLEELWLPGARVSDAGVEHLKNLPALEVVVLGDTTCTDDACQTFAALENLRVLNLNASQITDAGLARLKGLSRLETVRLGASRVTKLADLKGLSALRFLIVQNGAIGDEALAQLDGFDHLESLYLEGNPVTDDGIAGLKERRPELHLHW